MKGCFTLNYFFNPKYYTGTTSRLNNLFTDLKAVNQSAYRISCYVLHVILQCWGESKWGLDTKKEQMTLNWYNLRIKTERHMAEYNKRCISHIHCAVQCITCSDNRWDEHQSSSTRPGWPELFNPDIATLQCRLQQANLSLRVTLRCLCFNPCSTESISVITEMTRQTSSLLFHSDVSGKDLWDLTIRKHSLTDVFQPTWMKIMRGLSK